VLSLELLPVIRLRTASAVLAATILAAGIHPAHGAATRAKVDENPCIGPKAKKLRCPDLVIKRPFGMYEEHSHGRLLLRAGNSIDSIGKGPVELHGVRTSPRYMRGRQRIYKVGGGRIGVRTGARLQFKFAHENRRWWKFFHANRFELWRLDKKGHRTKRVRVGPKVSYCLRDLKHTRPRLKHSPGHFKYPACSTYPAQKQVTLGTSVGWSDVYPPTYPEQYIDVTGLRGCFAYAFMVDPLNGIYESNEDNNESQVIVRLPWKGPGNRGCPGHSRGPSTRGEAPGVAPY
jgi:hypothetical protein